MLEAVFLTPCGNKLSREFQSGQLLWNWCAVLATVRNPSRLTL